MGFLGQLGPALLNVLPMLDERSRRLVLGMAAEAEGKGGTGRVAALTGASWQTVANGKAELDAGDEPPPGRQRRPGGGRKPLAETDPGLAAALEKLIRNAMRGDPESPLVWTTRSAEHLAGELTAAGHPCSDSTAWRILRRTGFTQQSNSRAQEGRQHPERDGQFRHIAARSRGYLESGDPVISVDSKKREKAGNFGQDGRERAPAGDPVTVRSHDFPDRNQAHAIPYGIYDEKNNAGFVNAGTDGNTAALAVESVCRWWRAVGRDAYPGARRLLVTCDSGGSTGWTNKALKAGLAALAQETGLDIEVCHFPPGTSKWNRIVAPAVLPDQPRLARPAPDQLRRHHRHHRPRHHQNRAHRHRRPGRERLPHRDGNRRRADARHRGTLLNTQRMARRVELRLARASRIPQPRRRPRRRHLRAGPGRKRLTIPPSPASSPVT